MSELKELMVVYEMTDQEETDLAILQAGIRNGTTKLKGCLLQATKVLQIADEYLRAMEIAITTYSNDLKNKGGRH